MQRQTPTRGLLIAAFLATYVLWGSAYIAVRFTVETIPPFLGAGARFFVSGMILWLWARASGARGITPKHWVGVLPVAVLLFLINNGATSWTADGRLPSGLISILVTTVPIWIVLINWLRPGGERPTLWVFIGLAAGFLGIVVLLGAEGLGSEPINPLYVVIMLMGSVAWAAGSLYGRTASERGALPSHSMLSASLQQMSGGLLLMAASVVIGEAATFDLSQVSLRSLGGWAFLTFLSAPIGFASFTWLMKVTNPASATTYAYVNPVIAVFLGWLLADEPLTPNTLIGAAFIISAVAVINFSPLLARKKPTAPVEVASSVAVEQA